MNLGYLLDTNLASEQTRPRPDPFVDQWLATQPEERLFLSAITAGEVRKGIALLPLGKRRSRLEAWFEEELIAAFFTRVLPVTQAIAERCGTLSALRQQKGRPLGLADGLIAATALEHDLILVTRNTRDFPQLGVRLFNPWPDHPGQRS